MAKAHDQPIGQSTLPRLAAKVIVGFWLLHLAYRTTVAVVSSSVPDLFDPALIVALSFGFVMSFIFCRILASTTRRGLGFSLIAAALLSFPVSLLYASVELFVFLQLSPELNDHPRPETLPDGTVVTTSKQGEVAFRRPDGKRPTVVQLPTPRQMVIGRAFQTVTTNTTGWYFFYFGLGSFFVGMRSADLLRDSERRAARYEGLARQSQLEALRYQVNPHFLFNALNALSAIVMAGRSEAAETMILNLSRFYRSSLAIDPSEDITLEEELLLQRLYLDIESVRFPDRLRFTTEIDEAVREALIPALLLQPLIENTIKHGVARRDDEVTVRVKAGRAGPADLLILVENHTGVPSPSRGDGTGTGLRNVTERLTARFGAAASCEGGMVGSDLFRVTITLPFIT